MFKTNRKLRATIAYLELELQVERNDHADLVAAEKARADALDLELNGRPRKYEVYHYDPGTPGVKGMLKETERRLNSALRSEEALRTELDRIRRHNAALREALTALGGAVIELQDHIEVKA